MFVDEIKLSVSSGAGGPGSVSFNNLNSKTKPSGGSGGDGGSVSYCGLIKNCLTYLT